MKLCFGSQIQVSFLENQIFILRGGHSFAMQFDTIKSKCDEFWSYVEIVHDVLKGHKKEMDAESSRSVRRARRSIYLQSLQEINVFILQCQKNLSTKIIDFLHQIPQQKIDQVSIRWCYLQLAKLTRTNVRYLKLPFEWLKLGFYAGLLEDLVVVLRTACQLGISRQHLITFDQLIHGFMRNNCGTDMSYRFCFLSKLFENSTVSVIKNEVKRAIAMQGNSKRIGMYAESYCYALQGFYGTVTPDWRVVKTLNVEDKDLPPFAVHFTKHDIAKAIWENIPTKSSRPRPGGKEITSGSICRFDRPIHALTNIEYDGKNYMILSKDKDMRGRMTHGIAENMERKKYESGLVIDVRALCRLQRVKLNEIGTLLVDKDIPRCCLLAIIDTPRDIERFWRM